MSSQQRNYSLTKLVCLSSHSANDFPELLDMLWVMTNSDHHRGWLISMNETKIRNFQNKFNFQYNYTGFSLDTSPNTV